MSKDNSDLNPERDQLSVARADDAVFNQISEEAERQIKIELAHATAEVIDRKDWETRVIGKERTDGGFGIKFSRWASAMEVIYLINLRNHGQFSHCFCKIKFPHGYNRFVSDSHIWTPNRVHAGLTRLAFEAYLSS
jgi:hypothetical protein